MKLTNALFAALLATTVGFTTSAKADPFTGRDGDCVGGMSMKGAYLKDQWIAFHVKIAGGKVTGERWRGYEAWSDPASMVLRGARGDEYLVVIPEPKEFTPVAGTDEMTVTTKMGSTWTFKLNSNIFRTSGDRQQLFFGKTACAGNLQTAAEAFRSLPWPN